MNGVDTLNAIIAVSLDGAGTLAKCADIINDPRIKSLLTELAAERDGMIAQLRDEVVSLGGTPEDRGTVVGSAHRLYTEVKIALAPHDRRAVIEEIQRSEERIREKFQQLLEQDHSLPPAVREIVEQQFEQIRRACSKVNRLEVDTTKPRSIVAPPPALQPRRRFPRTRAKEQSDMTGKQRNEGEGNKTAAKEYNKATQEFVQGGKVDSQARAAEQARSGPERKDLDRAEQIGKSKAKEEDPQVRREPAKTE